MTDLSGVHWLTLGDISRENRRRFATRTAVVCGSERLNYVELDERVTRLANGLWELGVGEGDRLLWLGQNCHRLFEGLLAAAKLGAVFCPGNWRLSAEELVYTISDFAPKVVFWQENEAYEKVAAARQRVEDSDIYWIRADGSESSGSSYEDMIANGSGVDSDEPVDPALSLLAIYTSGFDGRTRAALLSHNCLVSVSVVQGLVEGITGEGIFLNSGPYFHIGVLAHALPYFHFGGTNVFMPRMNGEEACRLIEHEKVTGAYLVGPIAELIAEANADGRYNLSSLRARKGSDARNAMISPDLLPTVGTYGQTEVGGRVAFSTFGGRATGLAGRTSPLAQLRIVGPSGQEVATGEVGEIAVRGPVVMNGFHNREGEERGLTNGWRRTGDLGRREQDGSINFVGVKHRMLKSGVENIYPSDVEATIKRHPAVLDCAVIGVPDPRWDQSVMAILIRRDGEELTEQEVIEFCRENMASYKKPKRVAFVESFPTTAAGGVDYDVLDAQFGGGGYPSSMYSAR